MENGTGAAFALHFFLLRWHKPSFTKHKHKCVCEHSRVRVTQTHADKHKQICVSMGPDALPENELPGFLLVKELL